LQFVEGVFRVDHGGERVFQYRRRKRKALGHEIEVAVPRRYELHGGREPFGAVVFLDLGQVACFVTPVAAVQALEEVVQPHVVQYHYARRLAADLPDRRVMKMIVADVVETQLRAIQFDPIDTIGLIVAHGRILLERRIPAGPIRPQRDFRTPAQFGKNAERVIGDAGSCRRQR
jgi:hypothetical protein